MSDPARFLGVFAQALAGMSLYTDGHPARERGIDAAYRELADLQRDTPRPLFTFLGDEVVYGRLPLREMKGWDWSPRLANAGIQRLEFEEQVSRQVHPLRDEEVTSQMVATKRIKAPALRFWLARADQVDCAFLSSWPGANGVGKVEDLFTHPDLRHRGIATALIVHCVSDVRERGAGPVLIGALPNDTPMHMYAGMGFRPFCVTHRGRKVSRS